jgi:two-component system NtrC family sensor kinase
MAAVLSEGFHRLQDLQTLERHNQELKKEVAERRQVQEQLQNSLDELRRTQVQLIQSQKMATLGDLAAGISHEINSPVGAISSMHDTLNRAVEKLQKALDEDPVRESVNDRAIRRAFKVIEEANRVMGAGTERIVKIVHSLQNFVRLDEGALQMADLHEGLESALTLLQSRMGSDITLIKDYGALEPTYCSPGQLNQVFMHLLQNAVQSIEGKGEIKIKTFQEEDELHVRISDTGEGIPPAKLERIFDFSFEASEGRVEMALGFPVDYKIVQDHGGEIQIKSEVGIGTEVTVRLPLRRSDRE